jgi:hypothetical protein
MRKEERAHLTDASAHRQLHRALHAMTENKVLHELRNQLAVIVGFCDLLLREMKETDPHWFDVSQMRQASEAAMNLLSKLESPHR